MQHKLWVCLVYLKPILFFIVSIGLDYALRDHNPTGVETLHDQNFALILRPFTRWDAVFFLNIASQGYLSENENAFFPLFPAMVKTAVNLFRYCIPVMQSYFTQQEMTIIAALLINYISYILSLQVLQALLVKWKVDPELRFRSLLCYSFNPVRIFSTTMSSTVPIFIPDSRL